VFNQFSLLSLHITLNKMDYFVEEGYGGVRVLALWVRANSRQNDG
jgi:hypothetical protein